jgi:GNAT superfamily N-acetyltransferase
VKGLGPRVCEIKRMYVLPHARRAGRARELLGALEDAARELGYEIARLDTGPRQPGAERMYRDSGYAPIANFNRNPVASFATRWRASSARRRSERTQSAR